jgi:hypothetical protein
MPTFRKSLVGLAALAFTAGAALFGASSAAAQPAPQPLTISSSSGTPLLVNGLAPDKLPVGAPLGTEICLPARQVYVTEGERYTFQKWSTGSSDQCITPDQPGEYRAQYLHEVLLVVKSDVSATQRSLWATYAVPVKLTVPPIVQDDANTRYRFLSWSDGETPFDPSNTFAPVKPTTLTVNWAHEYQITVDSPDGANVPGSGWYAAGANLALRAPDTFAGDTDQQRYKFDHWESTSFPSAVLQDPTKSLTALKVDASYTLRAAYDKQYLVDASSPFGALKHDWVNDGDTVVLEAPATTDIVQDRERLIFKRWDGMGDNLLSPKIIGKVDKPISASAVYDRQVMLTVNAPNGVSGDGWHKAGDVAAVTVPGSVSQMFLLNSTFVGFGGYPAGQSSIQVLVNEPTTLTALYRTEPNLQVLALLLFLPTLAVLVYLSVTRGWLIELRARAQERIRLFRARRKMKVLFWAAAEKNNHESPAPLPGRNGPHLPLPIGDEPTNRGMP